MSVTSLICTYIYGTFQVICGAIEAYQEMAKGMLEKIEALAQSLITLWNYTVAKLIETAVDAVRLYQKKLADMIYDPSAQDSAGHNIWCNRLFDCLTFVNELLDPSSLLFKQLDKWFTKQCKDNFVNADLFNNIREILSDIQTFQKTVCNYGFTFSFGVETIKQILLGLKKQLLVNRELVNKTSPQDQSSAVMVSNENKTSLILSTIRCCSLIGGIYIGRFSNFPLVICTIPVP